MEILINEPLGLSSKFQNPISEPEPRLFLFYLFFRLFFILFRLVLKACFFILFGENVAEWFVVCGHWHWLEVRFWLVRLLFLLGLRLGLICKTGTVMPPTLQGCFRNKNERICVKHLAECWHLVSAQQTVWQSSIWGVLKIMNTFWSFWTCVLANAVPGIYLWDPQFSGSEGSSDDTGIGSGWRCLLSKSEHICARAVLVRDTGQGRRRAEVGEAEWEATCDNANHISWLSHLVLSLGKFLLVFCLTVSLCTSCYELVKKIIITWLWEMVMKYTFYIAREQEFCHLGETGKASPLSYSNTLFFKLWSSSILFYKFLKNIDI